MKITKRQLKQLIKEELVEAFDGSARSSSDLTKGMRSSESAKEVNTLSARERKVLGALQMIQKAMAASGDQATPKVIRLIQLTMDELQVGEQAPEGEPQ